jgi:hypothetical protein
MGIELVKVNARIHVGSMIVETPFIQSFNVTKTRGQASSFSASLKVSSNSMSSVSGGDVKIYAGVIGSMDLIYTGIIKQASLSPCWDDPGYVFLNISGTDVLSLLQGKKYTRRCIGSSHTWVSIDDLARPGQRSGKFDFEVGQLHITKDFSNPQSTKEVGLSFSSSVNYSDKYKAGGEPTNINMFVDISRDSDDGGSVA